MKWYIWLIIGIVAIVVTILLIILLNNKKDGNEPSKIKDINSLYFTYSVGYAANAYYRYELECNGKCMIKIKPNGIPEEETKEYEVSDELMIKLTDMLNNYEVYKWDGFDKSAKDVLDGDSFRFSIEKKDGTSIHASGYMMWPTNYRNVREEFKNIFNDLIKNDFKNV